MCINEKLTEVVDDIQNGNHADCLLTHGHELNFDQTEEGKTALYYAVESGDIEKVRLLVNMGASLSGKADDSDPIILATRKKRWDMLSVFLQLGRLSKSDANSFGRALLYAAEDQQWKLVESLIQLKYIDEGWRFNNGNYAGYFALHFLVLHNQTNLLAKYLTKLNPNVQKDEAHPTALTLAARSPEVKVETIVCLLICSYKADILLKEKGKTTLYYAVKSGDIEKVRLFAQVGASLSGKTDDSDPTMLATIKKRWDMLFAFLQLGRLSESDANSFGRALLHATEDQQWKLVESLIQLEYIDEGWRLNNGNYAGYFALHFLVLHNQTELLTAYLKKLNPNVQKDEAHPTALTLAARSPAVKVETIECLLTHGHELNFDQTEEGKTALYYAVETDDVEKARLILKKGKNLRKIKNILNLIGLAVQKEWWDLLNDFHPKGFFTSKFLVLNNQAELLKKSLPHLDANAQLEEQRSTALTLAARDAAVTPATLECFLTHAHQLNLNQTEKGRAALYYAVEAGNIAKVRLLVNMGASLSHKRPDSDPIILAARKKHWDMLPVFLQSSRLFANYANSFGYALLFVAKDQQWGLFESFMQLKHIDYNQQFYEGHYAGYYALHFLVLHNQTELLTAHLKKQNANVQKDKVYLSALTLAAQRPEVEVETLECLLTHGHELNFDQTEGNFTPLDHAIKSGQREKVILLIQHDFFKIGDDTIEWLDAHKKQEMLKTVQLQHNISKAKYLLNVESFKGCWILTRAQLDYVILHDVKNFKRSGISELGCVLYENVDLSGFSFDALGMRLYEMTVSQYTSVVFSHLSKENISENKPWLSVYYPYEQNKKIGRLNNEEFLSFSRWLNVLCVYFQKNNVEIPAQLAADNALANEAIQSNSTKQGLFSGIIKDCGVIKAAAKISEEECRVLTSLIFQKKFIFFEKQRDKTLEEDKLQELSLLLKNNFQGLCVLDKENPFFQFCLVATSLLLRAGYLQSDADLPKELSSIGVSRASIEELDLDRLIWIDAPVDSENAEIEQSKTTKKIFVVDEVISRLREAEKFLDPLTLKELNRLEIVECLKHPDIREALYSLHKEKQDELMKQKVDDCFDTVIEKMREFGQALWDASTDSKPRGAKIFDKETANSDTIDFIDFMTEEKNKPIVNQLDQFSFSLKTRSYNKTSFKELQLKATFGLCAGQLGVAIKEWADCFKKQKDTIVKASAKASAKASKEEETVYSQYLKYLSTTQAVVFKMYKKLPKLHGEDYVTALSTLSGRKP